MFEGAQVRVLFRCQLHRFRCSSHTGIFPYGKNLATHLNLIISHLVESEPEIDGRLLDLWRGMAAGSQAQGSWQNAKGTRYEAIVQQLLIAHFSEAGIVAKQEPQEIELRDGRAVKFGSDPDIRLLRQQTLQAAVEIKGGIDPAGAHERLGAAIKTLRDCKANNPNCTTILLLRRETLTGGLEERLSQSSADVTRWFTIEEVLEDESVRREFVRLLLGMHSESP